MSACSVPPEFSAKEYIEPAPARPTDYYGGRIEFVRSERGDDLPVEKVDPNQLHLR